MSLYSLLTELDRKVILFSYEKRDTKNSPYPVDVFNDEYRTYILTEGDYILWELEKRKLSESEIIAHSWLVSSRSNTSLLFNFQENNHLDVSSLFDKEKYDGKWDLQHGILKVHFNYHDHDYDIDIIANNNGTIHSALQIKDDSRVDILKVVPVSHAKCGQALIDE